MNQQRRGSSSAAPNDNADDDVFDAKTVIRPNPSRPTPPPVDRPPNPLSSPPFDRSGGGDDTPVPKHQPLSMPFDERTMVAPKPSSVSPSNFKPQPKSIPLGPKPASKPLHEDDEGSWNIQREDTHPGTQGGITPEMLGGTDRNGLILKALGIFAAVMILTLIARKCGKGDVEPAVTNETASESVGAPVTQKNKSKAKTPQSKKQALAPTSEKGSTEELLKDFDQAFFKTQSQTR